MTPDSVVNRGGKSESGIIFFVRDLLDDVFSICNKKKGEKKRGTTKAEVETDVSQLLRVAKERVGGK